MSDPCGVFGDESGVVAVHDLHVVEVVKHPDVCQVDLFEGLQGIFAAAQKLTAMINDCVEWFNVEAKVLDLGQFACFGERGGKMGELPLAVTACRRQFVARGDDSAVASGGEGGVATAIHPFEKRGAGVGVAGREGGVPGAVDDHRGECDGGLFTCLANGGDGFRFRSLPRFDCIEATLFDLCHAGGEWQFGKKKVNQNAEFYHGDAGVRLGE